MGFPNIDKLLVKIFAAGFTSLQQDATPVSEIFEDLDDSEQNEIITYVRKKQISTDIRDHEGSQLYILPNFPLLAAPLPQIGVTLGSEQSDRSIGDWTGEATPVKDAGNNVIAWKAPKGCLANSTWNINIVAATKDEVAWLTRICQACIYDALDTLDAAGVLEAVINVADVKIEQEQIPMAVFARMITVTGRVAHTWSKLIPNTVYTTGNNTY